MRRLATLLLLLLAHSELLEFSFSNTLQVAYLGKLEPSQLPTATGFGPRSNSVDVFGHLAVHAARRTTSGGVNRVHIYCFADPRQIKELAVLAAPAGSQNFGASVAVTDNIVYVGDPSYAGGRGAVFMYDVSDPANISMRTLTSFDANSKTGFGFFLAADGTRLLVGAPKFSFPKTEPPAAYLIDLINPDQPTQIKLTPNAGEDADFGRYGDLRGGRAIVGQISDSSRFPFNGAAYLYDVTDPDSVVSQKLFAADTRYGGFGQGVALGDNIALVGVESDPGPTHNAGNRDGAVWSFDLSDWSNLTQTEFGRPVTPSLSPPPPFGKVLSVAGSVAIIGAFNEDRGRGAVYLYDVKAAASPSQIARITLPEVEGLRDFGVDLAFDGRHFIVTDTQQQAFLFAIVPEPKGELLAIIASCCAALPSRSRMARGSLENRV